MSHTARSSRTNSPAADLRPAPLRIPVRKIVAGPDDQPRTVVSRYQQGARDISTSTLSREDRSQHPQSGITSILPPGRHLGPKLRSLKSQFEILHAVNSADTSVSQYSYKAGTSAIPRAAKSKQKLQRNLHSPSPVESISRASTEVSPRQTRTPAALAHSPCTSSTIPILRHARPLITPRGASSHCLPKSRSPKNHSTSLQQSPSTIVIFPQSGTGSSPKKATPGKQGMPLRTGRDSNLPAVSNIPRPQQRPSVADLRKSFEQFAKPVESSGGSARPSLQSKGSRSSIRQNQDMSPSTGSKLRIELLPERSSMSPDGTSPSRPPMFGRGQIVDVRPRTKATEQIPPSTPIGGPVGNGPCPSLPRSRRFELHATGQERRKFLQDPVGLDPLPQPTNKEMPQEWKNNGDLEVSMDGLGSGPVPERPRNIVLTETPKVQREQPFTGNTLSKSQLGILKTPKFSSLGSQPTQASGKVSRLRRFFEQSPGRFSSPLSLLNFRSRPSGAEPDTKLKGGYASSPWNEAGSPTSTNTVTRRRSIVPSLNTEISVNDFFCDFVGSPNYGATLVPASPGETEPEMESFIEHESPVKHRIQQFEHISRDSLKVQETDGYHGKANDAGLPYLFRTERQRSDRRNIVGGWRPIHQRGAAIWRKISNSFSRPFDSWKDCDSDHDHLNPTEGTAPDAYFDRSPSLANDPRDYIRYSNSFGHDHHVSHTSPQFISSSQTAPSIQLGVIDSLNTHPTRTSSANFGCSSPGTPFPHRVVRKRLPLVARVASGFHLPNGFGLDGHFPSKPVREEEPQPSGSRKSGPSSPQGDPNALLKVMLKQSAAERSRRRQDEKHLHLRRDIKSRTLGRWKGKGKADVNPHLEDATVPNREVVKKQDKGKGKEKEGGQENETNKKTESGFVVFESKHVKLRHPKPRRPGQVRKLANMYRDKGSSGVSVNTKASSGATLKESRVSFRQKASSALGLKGRKES
ncbi:hypothetical protein F4803DRAFT_559108 [Xylaria telfairii]|nr:hypothetical protein F4803DRAFT_559108 [Xylaria telfairii]